MVTARQRPYSVSAHFQAANARPGQWADRLRAGISSSMTRTADPWGLTGKGRIAVSIDPRPVGLFSGYIENEAANRKSFVKGWYYTDDMAAMDEEGNFWFIGRDDDVIKASGYRIGPFEVESALLEHPSVAEAAVVGSPDPIRGLIVKAFVVLKPGFHPSGQLRCHPAGTCQNGDRSVQVSPRDRICRFPSQDPFGEDTEE